MASLVILKPNSSSSLLLLVLLISLSSSKASPSSSTSQNFNTINNKTNAYSHLRSVCNSTPFPNTCYNSLKLSISINISPNILTYLLHSLQIAVTESINLSNLLSKASNDNAVFETQKGTIEDCIELHQITLSTLHKSIPLVSSKKRLPDAKTYLTAALTNKFTCLEGLDSASGPLKQTLSNTFIDTYKHISNSLSLLSSSSFSSVKADVIPKGRHDMFEIMESEDQGDMLTVSKDGTGNFTTITDAINFAPNNSLDRIIIYVKEGVYEENVMISSNKTNIVLLGDGSDVTVITGKRSVGDGWTTFRSATLGVAGEGFLARDIAIENTAGPEKHQAVALRINADLAAMYRCSISGYQDTLYSHSFRQFYRECDISGTIDYIFGNAAAVFQGCNIISRLPMHGQFTVVTAQSRASDIENTGFSIQNCSIVASEDLYNSSTSVESYLGRPWRAYSRTVYIESYIDDLIDPKGWTKWTDDDDDFLQTLYYGEYDNDGPGSGTDNRVDWTGYHVMEYDDAAYFSASDFIMGNEWLGSTSFPYNDGV